MFILKKGHQLGVYVPLRALFLVLIFFYDINANFKIIILPNCHKSFHANNTFSNISHIGYYSLLFTRLSEGHIQFHVTVNMNRYYVQRDKCFLFWLCYLFICF